MHILYLHQYFTILEGSGSTRSYEFARLLADKGHRITIITANYDRSGLPVSDKLTTNSIAGFTVIQLPISYSHHLSYFKRIIAFIRFVLGAIHIGLRQTNVDIVFATSTPLTIAIPAMALRILKGYRYVFEVRDIWPEAPIQLGILTNPLLIFITRRLEQMAYRFSEHIVALSPDMQRFIVKSGIFADKVTVIPNCSHNELLNIDEQQGYAFRQLYPFLLGKKLVVYAGTFGLVNGLDYVIDLAHQIAGYNSNIAFLLVGEGNQKEKIIARAKELGIYEQNVWILPSIAKSQIPALLSAADLLSSFVIPNPVMEANSANKFFDAFASGRPIVINYGGWQAKVIEEYKAGLVLERDVSQAARRLYDYLQDDVALERARQASRRIAIELFDQELLAKRLELVLIHAAATITHKQETTSNDN